MILTNSKNQNHLEIKIDDENGYVATVIVLQNVAVTTTPEEVKTLIKPPIPWNMRNMDRRKIINYVVEAFNVYKSSFKRWND